MNRDQGTNSAQERITGLILAVATIGAMLTGLFGWGWYRASTTAPRLSDLSPEQRQSLMKDALAVAPGVYEEAYFEPRMGYTLHRDQEITAWNDTFTSNELGYRTGSPEKKPGTFRVVFVGDSWTFGMGVREEEAFPKVFERLANQQRLANPGSKIDHPVEAWVLALSGYNTFNELSALWYLFETLQPDAVVISPTDNDHHSTQTILPNGFPWRDGAFGDLFGDPHVVTYPFRLVDSFRSRQRWQQALAAIQDTTDRLERLSVPTMLYFAAIWMDPWVHGLVQESGIETPYVICPGQFTLGEWGLPPPIGHGTPAAHEIYGFMVYQGLAGLLGWPLLPLAGGDADVPLYREPPAGTDWTSQKDYLLRQRALKLVPESFRPSPAARHQCAGPMDPRTGLMGRATTLLVRRRADANNLLITTRRLAYAPSLYPLAIEVSIPSPSGGTRRNVHLFEGDTDREEVSVSIPDDIPPGSLLDVILVVDRIVKSPQILAAQSLYVESIEQID